MEERLIELRVNLMKADRFIKVHNDPMAAQQVIENCMNSVNALLNSCEGNQADSEKANCAIFDVSKMLPDLERCKNAADNYADLDGTGQYGLVRKSFNDGINWALNFIVKQQ